MMIGLIHELFAKNPFSCMSCMTWLSDFKWAFDTQELYRNLQIKLEYETCNCSSNCLREASCLPAIWNIGLKQIPWLMLLFYGQFSINLFMALLRVFENFGQYRMCRRDKTSYNNFWGVDLISEFPVLFYPKAKLIVLSTNTRIAHEPGPKISRESWLWEKNVSWNCYENEHQ